MNKSVKYMAAIRWLLFLIQWAFAGLSVYMFYLYYHQGPGHKLFNALFAFFFLGCSYQSHQLMARYYRDFVEGVVNASNLDPFKKLNRRGKRRIKRMSKKQIQKDIKNL